MKKVGIYHIIIASDANAKAFEEHFQKRVFPTTGVGHQTRGGIVTGQYLLKSDSAENEREYSWVVHWHNQGGSPFGSADAPGDPTDHLADFGPRTTYSGFVVQAEET